MLCTSGRGDKPEVEVAAVMVVVLVKVALEDGWCQGGGRHSGEVGRRRRRGVSEEEGGGSG